MPKPVNTTMSYMMELFQDSLLTGVPQIVQTRNIPRKILKTLILLACIIGFVYQTTEFMKIFYSYPTVLDIDVKYPDIIDSPAITYCNLNGVKRIPFCQKYPEHCQNPKEKQTFCKAFPATCKQTNDSNLQFPVGEALSFEAHASPEQLASFGHADNVTLPYCKFLPLTGTSQTQCSREGQIHLALNDGQTGYRNCYTMFSNVNSSILSRFKLPVPKGKQPLFHMAFDMEPEQYFRPDRQVGAIVGIHSPNILINPFFDGFVVRPGRLYTVHLKVVHEKLLPSPYDTQCKDYKAIWKSRGRKGPLSQEACLDECVYNTSMSQCNCIVKDLLYPHEGRICNEDELDCLKLNMSDCYAVCQQPCDLTEFEYDVKERKIEDEYIETIEDFYEKESITHNRAAVLIFLKRPEIVVYSHRPQYEEIEVFSFLGGYVGMWLGISLVAVFDFFESVVLIINHWIRRRIASD